MNNKYFGIFLGQNKKYVFDVKAINVFLGNIEGDFIRRVQWACAQ